MLPASSGAGGLTSLTRNGVSVPMYTRPVKGMNYVFFPAADGDYVATYGVGRPRDDDHVRVGLRHHGRVRVRQQHARLALRVQA